MYVMWARTKTDNSEEASANYSFPSGLGIKNVAKYNWNYSVDNTQKQTIGSSGIALTGSPVFMEDVTILDAEDLIFVQQSRFSIYPNPNSGNFFILLKGLNANATLNVFNSDGSLTRTQKMELSNDTTVDAELNLNKGIYTAQLITQDNVYTQKLIVE